MFKQKPEKLSDPSAVGSVVRIRCWSLEPHDCVLRVSSFLSLCYQATAWILIDMHIRDSHLMG